MLKVCFVCGTRPELIKLAPVIKACRLRKELQTQLCLTGQHQELLASLLEYFDLEPDAQLNTLAPGQSLASLTARLLPALDECLERLACECVVVQGDTTTVLAAGLAAFYRRLPLVHVEAGLRTHTLHAPFPEELNRRIASLVATVHCAPTPRACQQLLREGIPESRVHLTGNTVIDALLWTLDRERTRATTWQSKYASLGARRLVLITGHRRENFGQGMERICQAIRRLATDFTDVEFLYPAHLNPRVQEPVQRLLGGLANLRVTAPVPYPEFVWLMDRCTLLLSDSGGIQEEAPSLGKPVVVMRETTERPEAVECGAAELVGTDPERIVVAVGRLLRDPEEYANRQATYNPYGDGTAGTRIAEVICRHFVERRV